MLIRKITKVIRKYRWSLPTAGSVPIRWHVGQPNFGDDLNPYFFEKLLECPVRFSRQSKRHLLGIGSILNIANYDSIVVGSGLLSPDMAPKGSAKRIISLRGFLTAESIRHDPIFFGDPAVLVARLFPQSSQPIFRLGLIPHHSQSKRWKHALKNNSRPTSERPDQTFSGNQTGIESSKNLLKQDVLFIDPGWHPLRVLDAITRCQGILSQSLHGLIIADAYGIPNGWLAPATQMNGFDFKFTDYYSTTKAPKSAITTDSIKKLLESKHLPLYVSPYRFDVESYQSYLKSEINRELISRNSDQCHESDGLAVAS